MNIQCPNPECRAENPAGAKFCRKCGTALEPAVKDRQTIMSVLKKILTKSSNNESVEFTLDTFKRVDLKPVSVEKIKFVNLVSIILCVICVCSFFVAIEYEYELAKEFGGFFVQTVQIVIFGIAVILFLIILKSVYKKIRFKCNADYIEPKFRGDDIVRIARKSKMGLFDKKKKRVLLPSKYSDILIFGSHILICKGNKKGLYSLEYRKIIIPVLYDSISQFENSVATATLQGVKYHYDVKGNKLR